MLGCAGHAMAEAGGEVLCLTSAVESADQPGSLFLTVGLLLHMGSIISFLF